MNKTQLEKFAQEMTATSALNRVFLEKAGEEIRLFDAPLFGYASADDALFERYKMEDAIGPHHRSPHEWLPAAQTVISFFLPFSDAVRKSNRDQMMMPGEAWLYGRIEGQAFVGAMSRALVQVLEEAGGQAIAPSCSGDFYTTSEPDENGLSFTSNWSERHAAYACGLGTFGLSKGLITKPGMAGRFGSVITDLPLEPSARAYTGIYDFCIRCGACVSRCPGHAITLETGKNHQQCLDYQKTFLPQTLPRFGCGLCQTGVPCEKQKPIHK